MALLCLTVSGEPKAPEVSAAATPHKSSLDLMLYEYGGCDSTDGVRQTLHYIAQSKSAYQSYVSSCQDRSSQLLEASLRAQLPG